MEQEFAQLIEVALAEDLGTAGDLTTRSVIDEGLRAEARIKTRQAGVFAGERFLRAVMDQVDPGLELSLEVTDGAELHPGQCFLVLRGSARSLLVLERTLLNLLGLACGIATKTRRYVELAAPHGATILDTRKTLPGLRLFSKYAVRAGGGSNHRLGLYDQVLIKDNHIDAAGSITQAVEAVRRHLGETVVVVVETRNLVEVAEAVALPVDRLLLDNMTPAEVAAAVTLIAGRRPTEVSGNLSFATVEAYARAGADFLSIGDLTKNIESLDLSMSLVPLNRT
ncbi:MAG: nicotinate-nucleotide diphosphorylase (carboxylating) [Deltaproteobacteria bacterium RIFOXYA12_FULL_61_11]|nr:MAG: nicotinate-nucleotide diphosphorylase (carboxylating) [Deltaproteobacteria bacterium RIFOXYA12_FULL_61_11]